jgi:hypothetical protein
MRTDETEKFGLAGLRCLKPQPIAGSKNCSMFAPKHRACYSSRLGKNYRPHRFFSHSQVVQDKSTGGDKCPDLRCRIAAMSNITLVLESVGRGDAKATEELFPLVYEELRRLAAARMAKEAAGHMLQPTALVHEEGVTN